MESTSSAVRLTDKDINLFRYLLHMPAISHDCAGALFYESPKSRYPADRLFRLAQHKLLTRRPYKGLRYNEAPKKGEIYLYSLSMKGLKSLNLSQPVSLPKKDPRYLWVYHFLSHFLKNLQDAGIEIDRWVFSGYEKERTNKERWYPFHGIIQGEGERFQVYFTSEKLIKANSAHIRSYAVNRKGTSDPYFVLSLDSQSAWNLRYLAQFPAFRTHVVPYSRAPEVLKNLLNDKRHYVKVLGEMLGVEEVFLAKKYEPFQYYGFQNNRKIYLNPLVTCNTNCLRNLLYLKNERGLDYDVFTLLWSEQQKLVPEHPRFYYLTLEE